MAKTVNKEIAVAAAIAAAEAEIAANAVTSVTNSNDICLIGADALQRWEDGSTLTKAGDACAIYAFVAAQFTMSFDVVVTRKGADVAECSSFDVLDLDAGFYNENGKEDKLKKSAAFAAIVAKLFKGDYEQMDGPTKQAIFRRALPTALYILRELSHVTTWEEMSKLVTLDKVEIGKHKVTGEPIIVEMLSLPTHLIAKEPDADASQNDKNLYAKMKDEPVQLDGKQGNSVKTLRERANPVTRSAQQNVVDKGKSLVAGTKMLLETLVAWNNPEAESDVAPNEELREQLFTLATELAAYFKADPLDREETAPDAVAA